MTLVTGVTGFSVLKGGHAGRRHSLTGLPARGSAQQAGDFR
ncbi:hypothetical protein [Nonomuraea typhae]|nr:hypothetical protein [Nonomuraea typhae]